MQATSSFPTHQPAAAPRADRIDPGTVLIFLHNLKTGGTTLRGILDRQYRGDEICVLGRRDDTSTFRPGVIDDPRLKVIEGHVPFGLHAWIPRPATYVTLLRDPVERIVSLYSFIRRWPERDIAREACAALGSLEAFVASRALPEVDNGQTRRLSGLSPAYGECSEAMLERAKANIREHFAVVGLTERFDESVLLMGRRFGWQPALYLPEKVNGRKERSAQVSGGARRLIEERNRLDRALYEYAAGLFERQVAGLGPEFRAEVAAFRWLNGELARRGERIKRGNRNRRGDDEGAPVAADLTADAMAMLLEAHVGLLAGGRDGTAVRRELNETRIRVRRLEAMAGARKQELRAARERVRALETSRLWRLRTLYRRARDRIAGVALLRLPD